MVKNIWGITSFIFLISVLSSCQESSLNVVGEQSSILLGNVQPAKHYGIFYQPSDLNFYPYRTSFFSKLNSNEDLPVTIVNTSLAGDRRSSIKKQALNYFVRVIYINQTDANGDYFHECPILSSKFELNSTSTALSTYLKYGFSARPVLSRSQWEDIIKSLELSISDIQKKNTSQILDIITTNTVINTNINNLVFEENSLITKTPWIDLDLQYVWSEPPLKPNSNSLSLPQILKEQSLIQTNIEFWNPQLSNERTLTDSWVHTVSSTVLANIPGSENYDYYFDLFSSGDHNIQTTKTAGAVNFDIHFPFIVKDQITTPVWAEGVSFTFISNRINKILVDDKVTASGTTISSIQHVSNINDPEGLILDKDVTTNLSYLVWQPTIISIQPDPIASGTIQLVAKVVDPGTQESIETPAIIPYQVLKDYLPQFIALPSTMTVNEGDTVAFVLQATDSENDPVRLSSNASEFVSGKAPSGSGLISIADCKTVSNTVCLPYKDISGPGHQYFYVEFVPSYSQVIDIQNGIFNLQFELDYDNSTLGNPDLASLVDPVSATVQFLINNIDDPPSVTNVVSTDQTVEENVYFSNVLIATVEDSSINPSALKAEFVAAANSTCNWWNVEVNNQVSVSQPLVVSAAANGSGGYNVYMSGTAPFNSSAQCQFDILIADELENTLAFSSPVFNVTDVNRDITLKPNVPDPDPFNEGVPQSIDIGAFFDDLDLTSSPIDPREKIKLTCIGCENVPGLGAISDQMIKNILTHQISFTPTASAAVNVASATYNLQFRVTDKGDNVTAERTVNLIINNKPSKPIVEFKIDPNITEVSVGKKATIKISPASTDPIDNYNYIMTPTTNCRFGFFENLVPQAGQTNLNEEFTFSIQPDYTDGNPLTLSSDFKVCNLSIKVRGPTGAASQDLVEENLTETIKVTNTNRKPDDIVVKYKDSTSLRLDPPASQSTFQSTTYRVTLTATDQDTKDQLGVDKLTFEFGTTTIQNGGIYQFKLPVCASYKKGAPETVFSKSITVKDGRGGERTETVNFTVRDVQRPPSCNL